MKIKVLYFLALLICTLSSRTMADNPVITPAQSFENYYEHSFTYLHNIPMDKRRVGFQYQHPDIRNYLIYNSISNYNLYVNFPVSKKFNLEIRLPFTQFSFKESYGSYIQSNSTTGYGNISFLLQMKPESMNSNIDHFAFGLTFPVFTADFYTFNFRDYIPKNNYCVFGYYSYMERLDRNYIIAVETGPRLWIPTSDAPNPDAEVFLDYGTSAGILFDNFLFNVELIGVFNLSAANDYELLRRNNIISAGLEYRISSFNVGLNYGYMLKSSINKYTKGLFLAKVEIII